MKNNSDVSTENVPVTVNQSKNSGTLGSLKTSTTKDFFAELLRMKKDGKSIEEISLLLRPTPVRPIPIPLPTTTTVSIPVNTEIAIAAAVGNLGDRCILSQGRDADFFNFYYKEFVSTVTTRVMLTSTRPTDYTGIISVRLVAPDMAADNNVSFLMTPGFDQGVLHFVGIKGSLVLSARIAGQHRSVSNDFIGQFETSEGRLNGFYESNKRHTLQVTIPANTSFVDVDMSIVLRAYTSEHVTTEHNQPIEFAAADFSNNPVLFIVKDGIRYGNFCHGPIKLNELIIIKVDPSLELGGHDATRDTE